MVSQASDEFLTNADWHQAVVGGRDMILRRTSALEFLQLFPGYVREKDIDANWIGEAPTMEGLVNAVNKALKVLDGEYLAVSHTGIQRKADGRDIGCPDNERTRALR